MVAQRAVGLAGHEGVGSFDPSLRHNRPLRMRFRQADLAAIRFVVQRRVTRKRTEDLRFFTAHHVGQRAVFKHARHDVNGDALERFHAHDARYERCRIGECGHTYGASIQPWELPTMPAAITGSGAPMASHAPQVASNTASKPDS